MERRAPLLRWPTVRSVWLAAVSRITICRRTSRSLSSSRCKVYFLLVLNDTMPPGISLRPITDADLSFLYKVYASTRAQEMALVPWSDAQKQAFVRMQFEAQHKYYREQFTTASFD